MKSRYLVITFGLAIAALALAARPATAAPAATPATPAEQITDLAIAANLTPAGILDVTEHLTYDFAGAPPHTIAHDIPINYQDEQGLQYHVRFALLSSGIATSPDGAVEHVSLPVDAGTPARSAATTTTATTVTAGTSSASLRQYTLHYTLTPIILRGDVGDILKYSSTGLGWQVPINQASFTLTSPASAANLTCYTGSGNATTNNCRITQTGRTTTITTDAVLPPSQSLGVYCNFPHGTFTAYLQANQSGLPWWVMPALATGGLLIVAVTLAVWLARRARPDYTDNQT